MKLPTAEQMRELDTETIEHYGVPGIVLMENAGRGACAIIAEQLGSPRNKDIAIFVGPGNNGGDGLVIARHLHQAGANPILFLLIEPDAMKGDAAINLKIVKRLPIPLHLLLNSDDLDQHEAVFQQSAAVVDSIFGTGLGREVCGHFRDVIMRINACTCPIIAVDIPSGLHADKGIPLGLCVRATITVTLGLAKPGLVQYPGQDSVGRLEIIDIGIPPVVVHEKNIQLELLDNGVGRYLPARRAASHKGNHGHLLLLAGSIGKTGAALLSAHGALRSGAGLLTICIPHNLNQIIQSALPEAMTVPLRSSDDCINNMDLPVVLQSITGKQAVAMGPGIGTSEQSMELVATLYRETLLPMVFDADALNILAMDPSLLANPAGPRILTPHPGEMSRLTGLTTKEIQADRLIIAQDFARCHGITLLLKGAGTIIADSSGRTAINPTGNPGMATGGMGDVLTGIIGALLAQGVPAFEAACLGAYAHGLAADRLAAFTPHGYLASETACELPAVFRDLKTYQENNNT